MIIDDLFENSMNKDSHREWRKIADSVNSGQRELCNNLYSKYKPFSDNDFKGKFMEQFYPAFWEMDLACTLMDSGFQLSEEYSGNRGPDICLINSKENRVWIEAICVNTATSPKGRSLGHEDHTMIIDSEKTMLRLTHAISKKDKKHKEYLKNDICKKGEPFIIAINGSLLTPGPGLDELTPRIVKAVFEGGRDEILFNRNDGNCAERQLSYRQTIPKDNGEKICINYFRLKNYSNISALLYSESNIWYRPAELGSDYVIVHNPAADCPVKEGFFQFGTEYIEKKDKNKINYIEIKKLSFHEKKQLLNKLKNK